MTPTSNNIVDASSERGSSAAYCGGGALKKGPWTAEEDAILVDYVNKHGEGNWNAVQRNSGLARCGKSCRLRWANHLRPNLKKGAFSPDEESLIVELHAKYGNKWARMASLLPGRTDNEIKNYWNTRVKRHQRQGFPLYPPDLQQQHQPPHHHHFHHHHQSSHSTPTTPTSSFSFQTLLSSPTTPTSHPYHPHHFQQLSPTSPPPISQLPSPHSIGSNSFTFQTQIPSPTHHPHHLVASFAPISPISPLSSPSTTNNNGFSTLALFDFSAPRTPPVLQTSLRFKRFSSAPASTAIASNNSSVSLPSPTSFSLPSSPLTSPNGSHIGGGGGGFTGLLSSSTSEFHKNLQENEKMCSLFAAVTQPNQDLPSSQMMPNSSPLHNMGIGIGSKLIGRRLNKKKYGIISKDRQGNHGISVPKKGLLEDLLRDAKVFGVNGNGGQSSREQNGLLLQEQNNNKVFNFDGFGSNWNNSNSLSSSSGLEAKVEATSQTNTTTSEDLTKLLDTIPSALQLEFNDSGEISNGPSSVITDDNMGFDMQHIASFFPTTTDHDRNLGSCSWDNLPRIC